MEKQNVLITWASQGLWMSLSQKLLSTDQYNVFGTSTSEVWLSKMEEAWIRPYLCDFNSFEWIEKLVTEVSEKCNRLDFLVNNAGIRSRLNLEDMTNEHLLEVFQVNIAGHMIATREAIKYMKGGNIIFMNSTAGLDPCWGASWYVASKHAMTWVADSIRFELQDRVGVSDVFLWWMDTSFHSSPRDDLLSPDAVSDVIYEQAIKWVWRWVKKSVDLMILWTNDNRRPVERDLISVTL